VHGTDLSALVIAPVLQVEQSGATRGFALPLLLGGVGADVELPRELAGSLRLDRVGTQWRLGVPPGLELLVNGRTTTTDRVLLPGDVFEAGGAQLLLAGTPEAPRLHVFELHGNDTVAPFETFQMPGEEVSAGTREIQVAGRDEPASSPDGVRPALPPGVRTRRVAWTAAAVLAVTLVAALLAIVPVPFELSPAGARLDAPETPRLRVGSRLLLLPGKRGIEVSHEGYRTERLSIDVSRALAGSPPLQVKLALLPGILNIDTAGLPVEVLVDDMPVGQAPGKVEAPAGHRTLILRAPRHLDYVTEVEVAGAGREQSLQAQLAPAWGWLELDTRPAGARIVIDGEDRGPAPVRIELDSGVRQLEVTAPGRRSWRSSISIMAGQTLTLGTVDLAAPPVVATAAPSSTSPSAAPDAAVPAPAKPLPPAARVQSPAIGQLILMPPGKFQQGSERREQGRRSNETLREVTLTQPFYLAEREITNGQFRLFRASHASGIAIDRTLDLDTQPVSSVSWDDAVEFCNWLSQREGLPVAYERRDGRWQFVEPRNGGYRLPTEAEWEYSARFVDGQRWRRFTWGDTLPMPVGAENVAGEETLSASRTVARGAQVLPGHRDEHPVAAPVGLHARTAMGFADMGGNVSEWVHDVYTSLLPSAAVTDPVGDSRVGPHAIRGANWSTASVQALRSVWRDSSAGPQQTLGFRVARSAGGAP
jgi:formylglycine-generating enzyme required for sulfatase activity